MYVFRINPLINKTQSVYTGEIIDFTAVTTQCVRHIYDPPLWSSGDTIDAGSSVSQNGFVYTSLTDGNEVTPEWNYVGYPYRKNDTDITADKKGRNTWIKESIDNYMMMFIEDSGGITASYADNLLFNRSIGTTTVNTELCSTLLLTGVLGASTEVNNEIIIDQDVIDNDGIIGNPETSGFPKAFSMTTASAPSFDVSIVKAGSGESTYCSGCFLGAWSYLGITQWTEHKKQLNDYSTTDTDTYGTYTLSKRRMGRTYNAEVLLTARKGASPNDYDYRLTDVIASVEGLLLSLFGTVNGFYFNNSDIGVPNLTNCTDQTDKLVSIVTNDLIVGVLVSFNIENISIDTAVLRLSVNSVPNQYIFYTQPETLNAPYISGVTPCPSVEANMPLGHIPVGIGQEVELYPFFTGTGTWRIQASLLFDNTTCVEFFLNGFGRPCLRGIEAGDTYIKVKMYRWYYNTVIEEPIGFDSFYNYSVIVT